MTENRLAFTPETNIGDVRPTPDLAGLTLNGEPVQLTGFTLTIDNPLAGERVPIAPGKRTFVGEVTGTVTATFPSRLLREYVRREQNRYREEVLRVLRPHMPKRMFLRLRGRARARDRRL